jgi:hypothetical protein
MKALVVKVKDIADYDEAKKPVVKLQIPKNLLGRATDEGNEVQQQAHLNQIPMRAVLNRYAISGLSWKDSPSSPDIPAHATVQISINMTRLDL